MTLFGRVSLAPGITDTPVTVSGEIMGSLHVNNTSELLRMGTMLKEEFPQKVILLSSKVISICLTKMVVSCSNSQLVAVVTST